MQLLSLVNPTTGTRITFIPHPDGVGVYYDSLDTWHKKFNNHGRAGMADMLSEISEMLETGWEVREATRLHDKLANNVSL